MARRHKTWILSIFGAAGTIMYIIYREIVEARDKKQRQKYYQNKTYQPKQPPKTEYRTPPHNPPPTPKPTFVSEEEIKKLYHELAMKYHPDSARNDVDKKFRTQLFIKIKTAYDRRDVQTLRLYKLDE